MIYKEITCVNDFDNIDFTYYNNVLILLSNSKIKKEMLINFVKNSNVNINNVKLISIDLTQIIKNLLLNNIKINYHNSQIIDKNVKNIYNLYLKQKEQPINNETYRCCIYRINLFFNIITYCEFLKKLIKLENDDVLIRIISIENGLFTNDNTNFLKAKHFKQWYDRCIIGIANIKKEYIFPNLYIKRYKFDIDYKEQFIYIPKKLTKEYFKYYNRKNITFGSFLFNKIKNNILENENIIYFINYKNIKHRQFILNNKITHNNWMKITSNICRTKQISFKFKTWNYNDYYKITDI